MDGSGSGLQASPARCATAVVKVASRCNLNCSYCYMYNMGDETWRSQPALMSAATVDALIGRVAEHCRFHALARFRFGFHGGEPLLAKPAFYRRFVGQARARFPDGSTPLFSMQTNGVLLTPAWARLLADLGVSVGVSLDGPRAVNDRQRVDHRGRGSFDAVRRGWDSAVAAGLRPGILTVVDVEADPLETYAFLKEMAPRVVDFLLPEANWDRPPPGAAPDLTRHADWLLAVFEAWAAEPAPPFRIRLFEHIVAAVVGLGGRLDALGPSLNEVLVIETDGAIEPVDVLRACRSGITRTPRNVRTDSLDAALGDEMADLYHHSNRRLCAVCDGCRVKAVCAGGYLSHRFSEARGFENPSVYCRDLLKLISRIQAWTVDALPVEVVDATGLVALEPA